MKKIFKALAAITFVTLFMSCNLTIVSSDSSTVSTQVSLYNYTGADIASLYVYDSDGVYVEDLLADGTKVETFEYFYINTTNTSYDGYTIIAYNILAKELDRVTIDSNSGSYTFE